MLTACGFEPLKKVPLNVEPEPERFAKLPSGKIVPIRKGPRARPSDFAVLALARSPDVWTRLRESFEIQFETSAEFTPPRPHFLFGAKPYYLLGLFADAEDLERGEFFEDELGGHGLRGVLFLELGRARDRIIRELRGKAEVVTCIFFADPDPDEEDRLYINLYSEYGDLVIKDVAQENNLFVFYGSKVAREAELDGWNDIIEATQAALANKTLARVAAEEALANVTLALANETLALAAVEKDFDRFETELREVRARLNKLEARDNPDDAISSLRV